MRTHASPVDFASLKIGDVITRRGVQYRYLGSDKFETVEETLAKRFDGANDGPLLLPAPLV